MNRQKRLARLGIYAGVFLVVAVVSGPYLWMVSCSFKSTLEIQSADIMDARLSPGWIPRNPTIENYLNANKSVPMFKYMLNSVIISSGTMIVCILLSLFAAYALSRFQFSWKKPYMLTLLSTQMFPGIAFLIPYFILFTLIKRYIGLPMKNTYWGMIFTYSSFALPFAVLMLRNYLDSIPKDIDEQAMIDGCSKVQIVFRIILPLSMPGIASVGIYAFIMAWNEILFASVLTGQNTRTVSLGLMEYITAQQANWGGMMAACILVSIPVLIFFTFLQKQIVEGLIQGATKG